MADRARQRERVRRVNAHRPTPPIEVTLVGSAVPMTPQVAAIVAELIALGRKGIA